MLKIKEYKHLHDQADAVILERIKVFKICILIIYFWRISSPDNEKIRDP